MTRPEPTIYGNCDSWDLIVGRKPEAECLTWSLQCATKVPSIKVIHSLCTFQFAIVKDNLWVICGSLCTSPDLSHMVDKSGLYMPSQVLISVLLDEIEMNFLS
jgi:hypothetical protein